jgi:LacI family transcriptional regulator
LESSQLLHPELFLQCQILTKRVFSGKMLIDYRNRLREDMNKAVRKSTSSAPPHPRIRDVAKHAGVSTATVSHILNGTRQVSDETRAQVLASVRELGYRPSAIARSLRTRTTGTIGILVSDISNPFSTAVVRAIEDVANENGHNVILCNTDESEAKAEKYLNLLLSKRVDGLILAPTGRLGSCVEMFLATGTPVVLIDRLVDGVALPYVGVDNIEGARTAVEHLIEDGHRRIGVITGLPNVSSSLERLKGYELALQAHGIDLAPDLVRTGHSNVQGGIQAACDLLRLEIPPTAIFTTNNLMTLGSLIAFRKLKVRCPEQIAILGFDDHEWAEIFSPPVSVVRQPMYEIGSTAARLLQRAIKGEQLSAEKHLLPTELVIRNSCRQNGHAS